MAKIEQVQELFRNLPSAIVGDLQDDYFPLTIYSNTVKILNHEIDDYLSVRDAISIKSEPAILAPRYYEHAFDILNNSPLRPRLFKSQEDNTITLKNNDKSISIQLGQNSMRFLLAIFDQKTRPTSFVRRRALDPNPRARGYNRSPHDLPHLRAIFDRMMTIKIEILSDNNLKYKETDFRALAEAALFNASYARGTGLSLSRSWERNYYRHSLEREQDIQFPRRTYNADLLAHYHLALSSDSLILAYLSLYKILEYFYVSAGETIFHKRLKEKLISPGFSPAKSSQLRDLVNMVRKFDQKTNEEKMLANVIEQYFMSDEIADWLHDPDNTAGQHYTTIQTVFGLSHKVDLNADQLASSLAKRVYHLRNALVHNKEGDLPRFIPFTGQEDVLTKELPLILFLAESLIVKTGTDI